MLSMINLPLANFHKIYRPKRSDNMDSTEDMLIAMVCARFPKPNILEIGTQYGCTTANMARIVKPLGGHVWTADVMSSPHSIPEEQRGDCRPVCEIGRDIPVGLRDVVTQILIDPNEKGALLKVLCDAGREFDFVFVDGDHSYEGVKLDSDVVWPRVKELGVVFFHDVWWDVEPPPVDGPLKLMEEVGGSILNMTHLGVTPGSLRILKETL